MNIFWREIKAFSKFTTIWTVGISAWIIILSLFFPAFYDNAAVITKTLESYPETVRNLIGLSQDSLSSFLGFYTFVFNGVVELGIIQAVILGASVIFKEVSGKTADFLFTRPATRRQIITSKLSASCISLLITTIVCFLISSLMAVFISPDAVNFRLLFMVSITLFFIQLLFMVIGTLLAVVFVKMKSAAALAIGALLINQILFNIFKPVLGDKAVRYIIPIKYFNSEYIIKNTSYEASFIVITFRLIIAGVVLSLSIYEKKDVHAA
jgi:ABC-2 type transport system permease protein